MLTAAELVEMKCIHRETGLTQAQTTEYLKLVPGWSEATGKIVKTFSFKNYYETLAFINAIAYIIHAEDHHPELVVTYNRCIVKFDTHTVNDGKGGISVNDFVCAAKIDAIFAQSFV
jgi:4a-hydroxytetrahydrobiopterin dehydratase